MHAATIYLKFKYFKPKVIKLKNRVWMWVPLSAGQALRQRGLSIALVG